MAWDIHDVLMRIEAKLDENTFQTAENTLNLKEHMRRTAILEDEVNHVQTRLAPLEAHTERWAGVGRALALGTPVAAATLAFIKILADWFKG